jgi:hypothetical protein
MVLGFCIGGPFIWNLLKREGDRVVAAVLAQPSSYRVEMPLLSYNNNIKGWGPELCARRTDITMAMVDTFLTNMYGGARADVATAPVCAHKRSPGRVFNPGRASFPLCWRSVLRRRRRVPG